MCSFPLVCELDTNLKGMICTDFAPPHSGTFLFHIAYIPVPTLALYEISQFGNPGKEASLDRNIALLHTECNSNNLFHFSHLALRAMM